MKHNTNKYKFRFKSIIILLVFFIYSSLSAQTPGEKRPVSLKDAVTIALNNNEKIKQYQAKLDQKKYQNYEAWGNFLPRVELNGSYTHLNDPLVIDLSPIRDAMITIESGNEVEFSNIYNILQTGTPLTAQQRGALNNSYAEKLNSALPQFNSVMKKQDYKSANFTAVQPVFTGGKLLAAKLYASSELDAAETELKQTRDEVKKDAVEKYLNVMLLNDVLKVKKEVLAAVKKHRDWADKLLKQGLIPNYNLLRAEVAVADAEKGIDDTIELLELATLDLADAMGLDDSEANIAVTDSFSYSPLPDSLSTFANNGATNNSILKLIEFKKEAVNQKYNIERSSFLPTVALFGKYEMYPQYLSILEPRWTVGVSLSMNLFNGFKDYSRLQQAGYLGEEVNHLYSDTKSKIELLITKNYKDMVNAQNNYMKNEKTISLAAENLRLNEKRFETGLGISLEVIDAYLAYEKTQTDARNYLFNYYTAYAELCFNTGSTENLPEIFNRSKN